jgi:hypothetical protein
MRDMWPVQARSAAQQPLPDGGAGPPLQGAVQVDAACGLPEGLLALGAVLSDAVKGALPGMPHALQVHVPLFMMKT